MQLSVCVTLVLAK